MNHGKSVRLYRWLCFLILDLIVLGAAVRAMDAGLACPDWPLCFGDWIPDYHPQVYFEFIHRVLAGAIAILFIIVSWGLWRQKKLPKSFKAITVVAGVVLAVQIVVGGLTVLKLLQAGIVTTHLVLGLSFLALLYWNLLSLTQPRKERYSGFLLSLGGLCLLLVAVQIVLGGLVASNYAGKICGEFPLCLGEWIPTLSGAIGLQVIHRLMAYTLIGSVSLLALWASRASALGHDYRKTIYLLLTTLWAQLIVGILNVIYHVPPLITILHSGLAATALLLCLRLIYQSRSNQWQPELTLSRPRPAPYQQLSGS